MPGVGEVPKVAPSSLSNSWEGTGLVGGGMKAGHRPWPAGPAQTVLLAALVSQRATVSARMGSTQVWWGSDRTCVAPQGQMRFEAADPDHANQMCLCPPASVPAALGF